MVINDFESCTHIPTPISSPTQDKSLKPLGIAGTVLGGLAVLVGGTFILYKFWIRKTNFG